ncbi:hypothetical protein HELRODRAFT_174386 [Helobdella robusta]|uniref:PiggyBac transposable element-derived protein domain-containing protein n=1 Tax=Helobdella robusta TaxID=6412 RepID=T1F824_HELRO|nr:hypothetical protein HELRODRAFT_174386 [Helobdella robusta]ESO02919.1 hypothetical protein HELRODRAFT_174386 [Helobdella robusta]
MSKSKISLSKACQMILEESEEDDCEDYVASDDDNEIDCVEENEVSNSESENDMKSDLMANTITHEETYLSKNKEIVWHSTPETNTQGRAKSFNIVKESPGFNNYAKNNVDSISSSFLIYFRSSLLEQICHFTNQEGQLVLKDGYKKGLENSGRNITCDNFFYEHWFGRKVIQEKSDNRRNN